MRNDTAQIPWVEAMLVHPIQNPVHTATEHCYGYRLTHNEQGYGVCVEDPVSASLDYQAAAVDGDPVALNNLGCMYALGVAYDRNCMIAARILAESEWMGCTAAAVNAGMMWEDENDYERACACYRRAYMQGDPIGQFCYAGLYEHKRYVEQDDAFAYRQYIMLAQENYGDAYGKIAHMLQEGRGVPRDLKAAVKWYRRGEACGDPDCTYELAMCYYKGRGISKNMDKAIDLLDLAAQRRDVRAVVCLGLTDGNNSSEQRELQTSYAATFDGVDLRRAIDAYNKDHTAIRRRALLRAILKYRHEQFQSTGKRVEWIRNLKGQIMIRDYGVCDPGDEFIDRIKHLEAIQEDDDE